MDYQIVFTFTPKPNKNGSYSCKFQCMQPDGHCVVQDAYDYMPSRTPRNNNEVRSNLACAIRMRLKQRYGITGCLRFTCLNASTDFMSRSALIAEKKRNKVTSTEKAEPQTPAAASSERQYELIQTEDSAGKRHWTIVKSDKKFYSEEEVKEIMWKKTMEQLNG